LRDLDQSGTGIRKSQLTTGSFLLLSRNPAVVCTFHQITGLSGFVGAGNGRIPGSGGSFNPDLSAGEIGTGGIKRVENLTNMR
jgi:hypothetical protein